MGQKCLSLQRKPNLVTVSFDVIIYVYDLFKLDMTN
jgi:hypothetical protein